MAGLLIPADQDAVVAELRRWASAPFDLAADNCGLAVLAFAERAMGRSLRRGRGLVGARTASRLMRRPDEFLAISAAAMRRLGCAEIEAPTRGDVGLVDLPAGLTACICLGPAAAPGGAGEGQSMWAARGDRAAVLMPATALMAWRVPCHRL